MSHNPDFLDTIDEVAATEEFSDSVLEYMYDFSDFLMFIEKRVKRFPELQKYLTEDSHDAILKKHINLTNAIINISQIEDALDESERAPVGENTIPFRKYNQPYEVFGIMFVDDFLTDKKALSAFVQGKIHIFLNPDSSGSITIITDYVGVSERVTKILQWWFNITKNSPDLIHKYSVPIEFLNERIISFGIICEKLKDIYQDNPEIQRFLNDSYLDELCCININLVEIIGKMDLAEADFEKKNPHLKYNPPGWERFQKYHQPYRFVAYVPPLKFIRDPQMVEDFLRGKIYIMYSFNDHIDKVCIFTDMINVSERVAEILH